MRRIDIRRVRHVFAAAMIAMALAAFTGAIPSWAQSGKYKESPLLTEQVKTGKLPDEQRGLISALTLLVAAGIHSTALLFEHSSQ